MKVLANGDVLFENVKALYPRLDKCYRFDSIENKTVPAQPTEDGAAYEISFEMDKSVCAELHKHALKIYTESAAADTKRKWKPEPMYMPYKSNEEGNYVGKAKLKGAYSGDVTRPPLQKDAERKDVPQGFQLTTGSTVNVWGKLFAYNTGAVSGVALRLKGVQVIELAERDAVDDPFSATSGFSASNAPAADTSDPFGLPPVPTNTPSIDDSLDDAIPF